MAKKRPPFKKVELNRGYKQVAQQIQQAIMDQNLKPGDKLPPLSELMDMFQVSKFTLIGAFRVLEQSGLVYTKHGATGGTFVSEMDTKAFGESLKLLLDMKKVTLAELVEFRLTIEGRAAYLAAKRRRSEDIKKLKDLLNTMQQVLGSNGPMEEMARIDIAFHLAIAEASHNSLYLALMETINQCFLEQVFSFIPLGTEKKICASLLKILTAIEEKKSSTAEKTVRDHITLFNKLIIENLRKKHSQG